VCKAQDYYSEYQGEIERALYQTLYSAPFSSTSGRGMVQFSIEIDQDGYFDNFVVQRSSSPEARKKTVAATERINRFSPPPEYTRWFEGKPTGFNVEAQGIADSD
jgi:hypothetical protein